jgi:delta24-sterol reductase
MPKLNCVERWRAEIVVFVVLPISFFLRLFKSFKRWWFAPKPEAHNNRVHAVLSAMRSNSSCDKLIRTDRSVYESHSVRNSNKTKVRQVPLRELRAILGLTVEQGKKIIHVEPGATVGEVTNFLQEKKLQLECCLEMEDATLGGLAMAQGMTTHSHICGLLSETVVEYEVITGNGNVVIVREDNEHADLFRALPMSHGSLGLLVSLKLRVVPARKYVLLTYQPMLEATELHDKYTDVLNKAATNHPETPFFVEAIAYSRQESVLMTGHLVDDIDSSIGQMNSIGMWYKPWFYKHVETILSNRKVVTEYIPMRDYLMRHDRSMCMTMGTIIPYGNHPIFRFFLGWLLPPQLSFMKSSHTKETREASVRKQCYQDICFPASMFLKALDVNDRLFNIYPLLVYPCKVINRGGLVKVGNREKHQLGDGSYVQMNMNLGIYGIPPELKNDVFQLFPMVGRVRKLEQWLRDNNGFQHTYCDSFQTKNEFHHMFDHIQYNKMRNTYGAEGKFPTVYDKTRPEMDVFQWLEEEEGINGGSDDTVLD